jgi:hypothetical protein
MIRRRDDRGRRRDQIDEASQRTRRRDDMLKTAIATKCPPHVRARHRRVQVDNPGTPCGFAAPKMFRATTCPSFHATAASGIGAAVVDRLLAEGMNVFGSRRCIPGHLTTSPPL